MNHLIFQFMHTGIFSLFALGGVVVAITILVFCVLHVIRWLTKNVIVEFISRKILEYLVYLCMIVVNYIACFMFVFTVCDILKIYNIQTCHMYSLLAMLGCILLAMSPISEYIYRIVCTRKLSQRELRKVEHILAEVMEKAQQNGLKLKKIHVRVPTTKSTKKMGACVVGSSTLVLTKRFLDDVDTHLIHGVIAHELGHFRYGDAKKTLFIFALNFMTLAIFWVMMLLQLILKIVTYIPFVNLIVAIVAWVVLVNLWILYKYKYLVNIVLMSISRMDEFRADAYAKKLGYGILLARYLDEYASNDTTHFLDTHPNTELRIDALT